MKGDFTRDTFDRKKHFSRVLMQQGRVTLDADHNEQTAILLHYLQRLARDLIGPYGVPTTVEKHGFQLNPSGSDIQITAGHFYVNGILVENDTDCLYTHQVDYPLPSDDLVLKGMAAGQVVWFYLDVWERHITPIEDETIREGALGGVADTCTRAQVVWQVKALLIEGAQPQNPETLLSQLKRNQATLSARVDPGKKTDNACVTPPESKYRGTENQLYRVEIHDGSSDTTPPTLPPTFKWSRDNGSIASAWLGTDGYDLIVRSGRGFAGANWVELSDDTSDLQGKHGVLVKLAKVEGDRLSVDPSVSSGDFAGNNFHENPKVRRWDQGETDDISLAGGAIPVSAKTADGWIEIEAGVQIQFSNEGEYRTGDYWLIPARVATGKIEWPEEGNDVWQLPHGVDHEYAPLGFMHWTGIGFESVNNSSNMLNSVSPVVSPKPKARSTKATKRKKVPG